jgi:hypothetical protein
MNKIKLRLLYAKDREGVFDLLQNPKVMKHIGPRRPLTDGEVLDWINSVLRLHKKFIC